MSDNGKLKEIDLRPPEYIEMINLVHGGWEPEGYLSLVFYTLATIVQKGGILGKNKKAIREKGEELNKIGETKQKGLGFEFMQLCYLWLCHKGFLTQQKAMELEIAWDGIGYWLS